MRSIPERTESHLKKYIYGSVCDLPVTSQIALSIKTISRDEVKTLELDVLSVFCILKCFLKSVGSTRKKKIKKKELLLIKNSIKLRKRKCIRMMEKKFKLVQRFLPPDDDCFAYNLFFFV